jgi:hypothetical protein
MKFRTKLSLMSFFIGSLFLFPTIFYLTQETEKRLIEQTLSQMQSIALDQTTLINNLFVNEADVTKTLAYTPVLLTTLLESNHDFALLTNDLREEKITQLNK